jgi:Family of unknown function (DUF5832)
MSENTETEPKEVFLEADKEIPGQHYVALSFISPEKVLKNKDLFFFNEFLKDYQMQYKIKSTESFVMSEVNKVQEAASKVQDVVENALLKKDKATDLSGALQVLADLSGALQTIKEVRRTLTTDVAEDMSTYVKTKVADFRESAIKEDFETFLFKNKKRLDDEFFAKNDFRTTVQGVKIRGVYDTYNEAIHRCKTLQKIDPAFNVYVGQVGFWLPWDPEPHDIADQEYADDQLNTLMKKYKENEKTRDELYAEHKVLRMGEGKTKKPVIGASVPEESKPAKDMFGDEDPFMKRKREQAEAAAAAVTASVIKAVDAGAAALAAAAPAENTLTM